jgi:hypothetical protein
MGKEIVVYDSCILIYNWIPEEKRVNERVRILTVTVPLV